MRGGTGSYVPRGYSIMELAHTRPIKQRPAEDVRYCEMCARKGRETRLARDNFGNRCGACALKYGAGDSRTLDDWLEWYGEEVYPEYPPRALLALIKRYFGTLGALEQALGWPPKVTSNLTNEDRDARGHALIPEWRCEAINEAIAKRREEVNT